MNIYNKIFDTIMSHITHIGRDYEWYFKDEWE